MINCIFSFADMKVSKLCFKTTTWLELPGAESFTGG